MTIPAIPETWQQIQAWLVSLSTVTGILYGLWRYGIRPRVLKPARAAWERISTALGDLAGLKTQVETLRGSVEQVRQEVTSNGGGSVKDAVNRIEQAMDMQYGKLMAIIATATEPILQMDADGDVVDVNHAFELLSGYSRTDMYGWGWVNAVDERDRSAVIDDWAAAREHKRFFARAFRLATRDGREVPIRVLAKPVVSTSTAQKVLGWYVVFERAGVAA